MASYQAMPQLGGEDRARLEASIRERGVEVPVVVDENGVVIDGHHRAEIAESLGMEYPKEVRTGLSDTEKRALAVELNVARRHLTDAQKTLYGLEIKPKIKAEVEAERRRKINETYAKRGSPQVWGDPPKKKPGPFVETDDVVAERVGLGSASRFASNVKDLAEAERKDPAIIERVRRGEMDMADVRTALGRSTHRSPKAKKEAAERARGGGASTIAPSPTTPKPFALANVGPDIRRAMKAVHDATQRIRLLRSQHEIGRLVVGAEGEVLAREVGALRDELDGFAQQLALEVSTRQRRA